MKIFSVCVLLVLGNLSPETKNVFNCSRHQRLVTFAFRCCVQTFVLSYIISFPFCFQCIDCVEGVSGVFSYVKNGAPSQWCLRMVWVPQHRWAILLLQLANNGICLAQAAGIDWLARWAYCCSVLYSWDTCVISPESQKCHTSTGFHIGTTDEFLAFICKFSVTFCCLTGRWYSVAHCGPAENKTPLSGWYLYSWQLDASSRVRL